jgi:trans-L-3-hydroxyproline dehydratase
MAITWRRAVKIDIDRARQWRPPENWTQITTVDAHTEGEPLRVIVGGFPEIPGSTILEKRRAATEHFDHLRTALMWEPRGHADMYGCIVVPPERPDSHFGVLFVHNEGFSTMCGHGIIAVATVALETGMLATTPPETEVRIDTPAGLVVATARHQDGRVDDVAFRNVPSFVLGRDLEVEVPGFGSVRYDIAFGGAFYAFVDADAMGLEMVPAAAARLAEAGVAIKRAVMASRSIEHPFEEDLGFLYGTIFTGAPHGAEADSRNVCIFAEGELDRSPTGTGVSARAAIHHARGELEVGREMVIESILGTTFTVRVAETTRLGPFDAVIPVVTGSAHVTGRHRFLIDPDDPLRSGFLLR